MRRLLPFAAALALALPAHAQAPGRAFTPADLVGLDRAADLQVSPDGRLAAFTLRSTDLAANKGVTQIEVLDLSAPGAAPQVQSATTGANTPRFGPGGRLFYLKGGQVWSAGLCAPECRASTAHQVTSLPLDVDTFRLSPDGRTLVVSMAVFPEAEDPAATKAREDARKADKASGTLYTKLFVRHWDTWADGTKNHLFSLTLGAEGVAAGPPRPLTPGFDGDVPGKPFGGDDDYAISPDGRTVYFSARLAGRTEPFSTNFDVYATPIDGSAAPRDLTEANKAWDAHPVASPDGTRLAYLAMKRPGFESDRFGPMVMDLKSGATREVAPGFDRSLGGVQWSKDGRTLYGTADDVQMTKLFAIDVATGKPTALTQTGHVSEFQLAGDRILFMRDTLEGPAQAYAMPAAGGAPMQLTHVDSDRLAGVRMSTAESFSFPGWSGETVHGWVFKPYGFQPGRKYPVAFLIHGGPQGSWGDDWSYRWNPQTYTGRGYAVVMVDFHGSTGYGQAFTDSISGHWGDRPLEDLQKGWAAALSQKPWLDGDHACALGASYGGYMTYWIAGVWNAPWKCLVDHDGVFDDRMMGYETEELWFSTWEHGGPDKLPWQDPAAYDRFNPVDHVKDWAKPILVVHSGHDFRIPLDQGLAAFTAAQTRGIESQFLTFPDENHWVLKPANSLLWHKTVDDWLDAHLKPQG